MQSTAFGKMPITQMLRIMKVSALLLLICFQAMAHRAPAQITLKESSATLEKVLKTIQQQSDYDLFFSEKLVRSKGRPVAVNLINVPVEKALMEVFKNQDQLMYTINGKIITVKEKEPVKKEITPNVAMPETPPPPPTVHGRVTNEKGEPVVGVNISIKGGKVIGVTDDNGEFTLNNIDNNATLVFSAVTIETYEVKLNGRTELAFTAKTKVSQLEEVVVNKGYYTEKQRLSLGNVATVKASDIEKQPVTNPLQALQGRVPGLIITQNTGLPGGSFTVQIRGQNSIRNGNDPFYIVDGVPYSSQLLKQIGGPIGTGSPFNFINPSDIESIDILKDADATAIYGSRGANGVIIITTKKGKLGETKIDFNTSYGIGQVSKMLDLMSKEQYLQMRREAFNNDGLTPNASTAPDLLFWDTTRNTNWQKYFIGGTAKYYDVQTSVSGGNENTQFLFGGNYHKETTVSPGDLGDQKVSVHFNINNSGFNKRLKTMFSGSYLSDKNNLMYVDFTNSSFLPPDAPPLYNSDGTLNWANGTWSNPLSYTKIKYISKSDNLIANGIISYELSKGLIFKTVLGYNNLHVNEIQPIPTDAFNPAFNLTTGQSSFSSNDTKSWIVEPQLSYKVTVKNSEINVLLGSTIQKVTSNGQILNATGYTSNTVLENIQGASGITVTSTTATEYKYSALFARLNYGYSNKYLINLTARRDGSSNFGPDKRFSNFGAIGAGWVFSNEGFIKKIAPVVSYGKLRVSYGTSGNDQIPSYGFLDLYSITSFPYQGSQGFYPNNLFNPDFAWERNRKFEGGIELGLFNDRVMFDVSYFNNRSSNQLIGYPLPAITGFTSVTKNLPATVQNDGIEFQLRINSINNKVVKWNSSFNLTISHNKLVDFPDLSNTSYATLLVVGQPLNIIKTYHLLGVDPQTGVYQFQNSSGNATFTPTPNTDQISLINIIPKFYGGFQNSISVNNFQLDFLFQFVKQTGKNYYFANQSAPGWGSLTNQPSELLNHWKGVGDITMFQKLTRTTGSPAYSAYLNYARQSDFAYSDASFIRLKNVSLSYLLPATLLKKAHIQSLRLYIQCQNLFTITGYKGMDPENQSVSALPPLRVITGGIKLGL